jgi:hypothetical protein
MSIVSQCSFDKIPIFLRKLSPPSSGPKITPSKKLTEAGSRLSLKKEAICPRNCGAL